MSEKRTIELMPGIALVIDTGAVVEDGHTEMRPLPGMYRVVIEVTATGLTVGTGPVTLESVFMGMAEIKQGGNDE